MNPNPDAVDAYGRCRIEDQPECHRSGYHVPPSRPATTTVSTATGFPGFAPGEHRQLLAEVHRWARTNGWHTHRDTGWQNPSRLTQIDWEERGLYIGSRNSVDRMWGTPLRWPAANVRQAVDILAVIGLLPASLSSLAATMRRLADEMETEAAVHDAPAGSMFLDAGFRIRQTLDGEYEPTGDPR